MDVTIITVESSRTAVVSGTFDIPAFIPRLDAVYAFLRGGTDVKQIGQNIALYHGADGMEVGVEVDRLFEPAGDVVPSELPAGRVASTVHTGSYADLGATHAALRAWCVEHGETLAGPGWEVYGDPDERDEVATEVRYLLA